MRNGVCVFMLLIIIQNASAQIGINTTSPHVSSVLDVSSTEKGMLAPRTTTVQKNLIANPANSLLVYDTTLRCFSYYDLPTLTWVNIPQNRNNYKLVKSVLDLAPELLLGGGTKYLLQTNTLYEINGEINLAFPIELNNASIVGLDSGEDKLIRASGDLFIGSTGGYVKLLTLSATAGKVFNIVGVGAGLSAQNLIFRDLIIVSSANVGSLENFGLIFSTVVQYLDNNNGIVYKNIGKLLLENQGWFGNNRGTFEKLEGSFGTIQKQSGFSEVNGTATGLDVSSNPAISVNAVMTNVNFSGTGLYVNRYTAGSYPGYNFNDFWYVDSPGIPRENDAAATANLYKDNEDFVVTTTGVMNARAKVNTNKTASTNLFRFSSPDAALPVIYGRLTYRGNKRRTFQANATVAYESAGTGQNSDYAFYFVIISADGNTVTDQKATETISDTKTSSFISTISVSGTLSLAKNESVELYLKRVRGDKTNIEVVSYNLSLK